MFDTKNNNDDDVYDAYPVNDDAPEAYPVNSPGNEPVYDLSGKLVKDLNTPADRNAFVRKVYFIVFLQLCVTAGFSSFFVFNDDARNFVIDNPYLFYIAYALSFVFLIVLICCVRTARSFPLNYVFLFLFTIADSVVIGFLTAQFEVDEIFLAAGICGGVVFALTLFACNTKYDFTGWGVYLYTVLWVFVIFGFILIFVQQSREVTMIFALIGTLIFSMYIIYDTQLILGGNHRQFEFSTDEYAFAALSLYLDIVRLFIYILILVGGGRN